MSNQKELMDIILKTSNEISKSIHNRAHSSNWIITGSKQARTIERLMRLEKRISKIKRIYNE